MKHVLDVAERERGRHAALSPDAREKRKRTWARYRSQEKEAVRILRAERGLTLKEGRQPWFESCPVRSTSRTPACSLPSSRAERKGPRPQVRVAAFSAKAAGVFLACWRISSTMALV
jgi:hypothetical protein